MKEIIEAIQQELAANVEGLRYIDRDWGQLKYDQPPVKFPCALIEFKSVEYSEILNGEYDARVYGVITVADQSLSRSSMAMQSTPGGRALTGANTSQKAASYAVMDLVEEVCMAVNGLTGRTPGREFQPIRISHLYHDFSDKSYEVYSISFTTAYISDL